MLGRQRKLIEDIAFAVDVAAGVILLYAAYGFLKVFGQEWQEFLRVLTGYPFRIQTVEHLGEQGWLFLVILLAFTATLRAFGPYPLDLTTPTYRVVGDIVRAVLAGFACTVAFFYFFTIVDFNRSLLIGFTGVYGLWLLARELATRRWLREVVVRRRPREALLVGPASTLADQLREVHARGVLPVRIKAVLVTEGDPGDVPEELRPLVVGPVDKVSSIIAERRFDVIFLREGRDLPTARRVVAAAEEQGVEAWYFAGVLAGGLARPEVDDFAGQPVIVFRTTTRYEGLLHVKRAFDLVVALSLLLVLAPLFLALAILVKATSNGPVFFVQERTGWRGRTFRMLKFRTMVVGAEKRLAEVMEGNEMTGPVFKRTDDPRITPVGRFLRRYSLDELPQLLNVVMGEMSLVGPRPLPVHETKLFPAFRDHRRYSVLPGLTGLWQVSGRSTISDFSEWVRLDLEYIDRWSLWLDIQILARTVPVVLFGHGAR